MTVPERDAFIRFVEAAGEVNPATLPGLVDRALALVSLVDGEDLIGTAAIKRPLAGYRRGVFAAAGTADAAHLYQVELGWVHILGARRGEGLPKLLMDAAMAASEGLSVYATTKEPKMHTILPRYGFALLGDAYPSKQEPGAMLRLFVRPV